MPKPFHGPKNPSTGRQQAKKLEQEKAAAKRRNDAANLKVFEQKCKERAMKEEARKQRTEELRQERRKRQAIARKYL